MSLYCSGRRGESQFVWSIGMFTSTEIVDKFKLDVYFYDYYFKARRTREWVLGLMKVFC